jgi:DNA-directed RNA polymerase subunit alpha
MRRFEFIKPQTEPEVNEEKNYGKFTITPLERGYGLTIGNALRRVLMSSMPGIAIVAMEIEGVSNEYMALDGIIEDVTEIILNLKNVKLSIDGDDLFKPMGDNLDFKLEIHATKAGVVTAGDLIHESELVVVNPDQVILTLAKDRIFDGVFFARRGVGYVSSEENKVFCKDEAGNIYQQRIAIDSIYTPVTKVKYEVEKTRVDEDVNYDKLTLEIWTDKRISPEDAISLAAAFLSEHFDVISGLNDLIKNQEYMNEPVEKVSNKKLEKPIEDLDLSVRSYNCLKRANIHTIGELTQKTVNEMIRIRNLGRKSLKEVEDKLKEFGLSLRRSLEADYEDLDEFDDEDSSSNNED